MVFNSWIGSAQHPVYNNTICIGRKQYILHTVHERDGARSRRDRAGSGDHSSGIDNRKSCNCSGDSGDFLYIHIIIIIIKDQDQLVA